MGANDSDIDYFRYAKRSGALSDEELMTLQRQLDDTGTYIEDFGQPMYSTNFDDTGTAIQPRDTNAVAKDIVSSYMLDLLETPDSSGVNLIGSSPPSPVLDFPPNLFIAIANDS